MSTVALSPMAQQVEKLLKVALDNGATELRLSGGVAPMLRINDQMRPLKTKSLPAEEIEAMASAVMPRQGDPANFAFTNSLGRFQGMLVDNQGVRVLVLRPAAEPEPEPEQQSFSDGPLQLDISDSQEHPAAAAHAAAATTSQLAVCAGDTKGSSTRATAAPATSRYAATSRRDTFSGRPVCPLAVRVTMPTMSPAVAPTARA